jgi:hypothetical protein
MAQKPLQKTPFGEIGQYGKLRIVDGCHTQKPFRAAPEIEKYGPKEGRQAN